MPLGDGTGPAGMGPMTGRAAGYCAGFPVPGYMNPYGGRLALGFGWGGFGRGRWYPHAAPFRTIPYGVNPYSTFPYGAYPYAAPYSKEQEKEALTNQIKVLEDQIAAVRKRIEELETESSKENE